MNEKISSFSKVIVDVFDSVKIKNTRESINIYDEWKNILKEISINNNDEKFLSCCSRVIDLKNGILFIEVDHSGWIEILNIYKRHILEELKKKFPKIKFKTLAFFVK